MRCPPPGRRCDRERTEATTGVGPGKFGVPHKADTLAGKCEGGARLTSPVTIELRTVVEPGDERIKRVVV
jgi:hypothetical protein